jgi:hypothetical protein
MANLNNKYAELYNQLKTFLDYNYYNPLKQNQDIDYVIIYESIYEIILDSNYDQIENILEFGNKYNLDNGYELDYNKTEIAFKNILGLNNEFNLESILDLYLNPDIFTKSN